MDVRELRKVGLRESRRAWVRDGVRDGSSDQKSDDVKRLDHREKTNFTNSWTQEIAYSRVTEW